jgi:DNA-binding NtrC family response regulator
MPPARPSFLLVEPDVAWATRLHDAAAPYAVISVCHDFDAARRPLLIASCAFIVTNIRLAEYNGLQLVYLGRDAHPDCHAIAYTDERDVWLAHEAQRAGAFYETRDCLPVTLPTLLTAQLPIHDRRDPARPDRRTHRRTGGRRARDRHLTTSGEVTQLRVR